MTTPRYAIYFAPAADSALWRFGSRWLGRDAVTGEEMKRPKVNGFSQAFLDEITAAPRFYGFHATLKPPFELADGRTVEQLQEAADAFAAKVAPFQAPPLRMMELDGFVALRPREESPALNTLADDCVRSFDVFRRPPLADELAKRREHGLTPQQEALLTRWGYPYVMEEFRFHMTLTKRLDDRTRNAVITDLTPLIEPLYGDPLVVDAVCLYRQDHRNAPFEWVSRHTFAT